MTNDLIDISFTLPQNVASNLFITLPFHQKRVMSVMLGQRARKSFFLHFVANIAPDVAR